MLGKLMEAGGPVIARMKAGYLNLIRAASVDRQNSSDFFGRGVIPRLPHMDSRPVCGSTASTRRLIGSRRPWSACGSYTAPGARKFPRVVQWDGCTKRLSQRYRSGPDYPAACRSASMLRRCVALKTKSLALSNKTGCRCSGSPSVSPTTLFRG